MSIDTNSLGDIVSGSEDSFVNVWSLDNENQINLKENFKGGELSVVGCCLYEKEGIQYIFYVSYDSEKV